MRRSPTATPTGSYGGLGPAPKRLLPPSNGGKPTTRSDPPPADRLPEVETRFAGQLNVNPTDELIFMGLNTRARPFTDLRVRQALSYAVDRAELAQLLGQDSHPICQMLPPFVPGHEPYCPYTLDPTNADVWRAPDMRKALALIAASGTRGTPITIWNQPGFFTDFTATARYLVSLLDRLGYPTRVKTFSVNDTTFLPRMADSRTSPQAYLYAWSPGYPAASEFLGSQFWSRQSFVPNSTSNNNLGEFCDSQFDATVRSALAAEAARLLAAARCGPQRTGSSPIRPRWCPLSRRAKSTSSHAASATTSTAPVWVRCSTNSGCTSTALLDVAPDNTCRPPRSPRKSLSWREPRAPEMNELQERFFAMLSRPD
jgi:ABC-type transport system substrate-binding protein